MRLIDADALVEALYVWLDKKGDRRTFIDLITNAPTVQREGWVSVPIELLKDITNCFDNVPSRAHVVDGVDDNLKRIAQWVNSSDGGYGLYQAVNHYLHQAAPTETE